MARAEVNRSGEMEVFVQVVERGGFSSAARSVGMTPSAVSKLVARLEARLGTRLINRSTRVFADFGRLRLFERATRIPADIEDAERIASAGEVPSGRLRLSTSASYATHVLAGILPEFWSDILKLPSISCKATLSSICLRSEWTLRFEQARLKVRASSRVGLAILQ